MSRAPAAEGVGGSGPMSAADALAGLTVGLQAIEDARGASLTPPVAAAVRAALDWLSSGTRTRHPLRVKAGDSVLEVWCERVDPDGIHAATEVLAAVQANLGPVGEPEGPWRLRAPAVSARDCHLMLIHAGMPVAMPWHAVLRIAMATPDDLERLRATPDDPLVEPGTRRGYAGDVPIVRIGHGRKRGWLVADRLVWRLPANRVASASGAPWPWLSHAVRTDDGESFWVAVPERLLEHVEPPALPVFTPVFESFAEPAPEAVASPPASADVVVAPPEAASAPSATAAPAFAPPSSTVAPVAGPAAEPEPALEELSAEHVEPIDVLDATHADPLASLSRPDEADVVAIESPAPVEPDRPAPAPQEEPTRPEPAKDPTPAEPPKREPPPAEPPREEPPAKTPPVREPPQETPPASARPVTRATPPSPARGTPSPGSAASAPARLPALIAEDSIMARIFLTRMLEQHGLEVEAVDTAAELHRRLATRAWAVVCVDVELPDACGEDLLRGVLAGGADRVSTVVALVRDEADLAAARGAGISRVLRKPFDQAEVAELLGRLALVRGGRA